MAVLSKFLREVCRVGYALAKQQRTSLRPFQPLFFHPNKMKGGRELINLLNMPKLGSHLSHTLRQSHQKPH